jgi:hypothetical protein
MLLGQNATAKKDKFGKSVEFVICKRFANLLVSGWEQVPTPPVRDASSSLQAIRYGQGHEKFPSWPVPAAPDQMMPAVSKQCCHNIGVTHRSVTRAAVNMYHIHLLTKASQQLRKMRDTTCFSACLKLLLRQVALLTPPTGRNYKTIKK